MSRKDFIKATVKQILK